MSKTRQLPRESGVAYRGLFLGGLSKIGELLINTTVTASLLRKLTSLILLLPAFQSKHCCLH